MSRLSLTRFVQFIKLRNLRLLNTSICHKNEKQNRVWYQSEVKNQKEGGLLKIRVETLPKDRFEEVLDLKINHYIKDEITYKVSGVNENPQAIEECREIFSNLLSQPNAHTHVYFKDDDSDKPELIAASSLILVHKDDPHNEVKAKTKEMKRFFEIVNAWNQLYTEKELFEHYGIDRFYQDAGLVTHNKYRLLGIAKHESLIRRLVCLGHNVPATGAWTTVVGSQRIATADNWDTLFEMSYEELGLRLGVRFKDSAPSCKSFDNGYCPNGLFGPWECDEQESRTSEDKLSL